MSKGKSKKKIKISYIISYLILFLISVLIISPSIRYLVGFSLFAIFNRPAIFSELKTIVKDYNRDCEKGYKVKITRANEIGFRFNVDIQFKNNKIDDDNKRILFLQYLHNNFGYSELSCSNENTEYFNREKQTMKITFDNIILEYGNKLTYTVDIYSGREYFDVLVNSTVIFDFSILEDFNGSIVLYLRGYEDIKDELKQKYDFMIK